MDYQSVALGKNNLERYFFGNTANSCKVSKLEQSFFYCRKYSY